MPLKKEFPAKDVGHKLKWLMIGRVILITIFLGSSATLELGFRAFPHPSFLFIIIAVTYLLTIFYAVILNRFQKFQLQAEIQLSVDVLIATGIVYVTGGIESWFPFTYLLVIIAGSIILYSRGGLLVASLSSILYGGVLVLQYYSVLPITPERRLIESDYLYNLFINITAFYLVSYLSGTLSERLRKAGEKLEERDADLFELRAYSDNVIKSLTSGLFTTDSEGRITFFNKAAEEITGWGIEEIKGKIASELFPLRGVEEGIKPVEDQTHREAGLQDSGPRTPLFRFEGKFFRKDGKRLILGMGISPLMDRKDRASGFIGIFQDLTKIKELEEEIKGKEKMAAIGELSSWMAHEIRNPLASISGSIQVLKENLNPTEENINLIEIAIRETERLNLIVGDFLNYARPRVLSLEVCDINRLIADTISLLKNSKEFHEGIKINLLFEEEGRETDRGRIDALVDINQMKQVFWNLSINAVQAMPKGGELTIDTRLETQDSSPEGISFIEIIFRDTGVGIEKENLDFIFYPFFSTKEIGSGLGLAIAYRIIEEHRGKIKVESEKGKGTTFRIFLPKSLL
jgi:two-component system sensor histidine kinase PilS (NtrC family)